jgi:hypothetical protein
MYYYAMIADKLTFIKLGAPIWYFEAIVYHLLPQVIAHLTVQHNYNQSVVLLLSPQPRELSIT